VTVHKIGSLLPRAKRCHYGDSALNQLSPHLSMLARLGAAHGVLKYLFGELCQRTKCTVIAIPLTSRVARRTGRGPGAGTGRYLATVGFAHTIGFTSVLETPVVAPISTIDRNQITNCPETVCERINMIVAADEQEPRRIRVEDSAKPLLLALIRGVDACRASLCAVGVAEKVRTTRTTRRIANGTAAGCVSFYGLFAKLLGDQVSVQRHCQAHEVVLKRSDVCGPFWPAVGIRVLDPVIEPDQDSYFRLSVHS